MDNEDTEEIVMKIAEKVGAPIEKVKIEACHRITSKQDAAIICRFLSRKDRDRIMFKKENAKSITIVDLGFPTPIVRRVNGEYYHLSEDFIG